MPEPLSRKNQWDLENHEAGVGGRCRHRQGTGRLKDSSGL